jgi:hypothetical protein
MDAMAATSTIATTLPQSKFFFPAMTAANQTSQFKIESVPNTKEKKWPIAGGRSAIGRDAS